MKILCVIDSLGSGGAQRQLVGLAKGFKQKGHNVSFLTYHQEDFYLNELIDAGITVKTIIEPYYLKRIIKIRKYIRRGNYNSVLTFLEAPSFMCELAGFPYRKWSLVVGERNADPKIRKSIKLRIYRWFHLLADYVVSNSNANIEIVKKVNPFLRNKKLKIIYNIVDAKYWFPFQKSEIKNNGSNSTFVILVAARHSFQKNLMGLVNALHLLSIKERKSLLIEWYGDITDNSYNNGVKKIKEYRLENNFKFFSATKDIRDKILNSDAVGLFSLHEGLPNSICEAMSCGKPVICSKVSDMPLLLKNSPNLVFDPTNEEEICKSIRSLLSYDKKQLLKIGEQNFNVSRKYFESTGIIAEYLKLMT